MQWILIALGVILAVVAVFALQNPAVVTVRFLNFEADASVLVVILVAFAAGVFSGILSLLPSSIRKSGRMRRMSSELRSLEKHRPKETATAGSEGGAAVPSAEPPSSDARPWREAEAEAARGQSSADSPERRGLGRFFR
ncbi:MAG: LapA family protein [Thermoleophilia bacterium]